MFEIKPLCESDYVFAVELANTMNWDMAVEDFIFMASLESGGCFLLCDDAKYVGIATCVSYGKVGWFGNLVVSEEYRNKGAGSALVNHAITHLHSKGVKTVGLYAYPHLLGFYGKLGFRIDSDFSVLHAPNLSRVRADALPKIGNAELSNIVRFDSCFFGGNRQKLLESIVLDELNTSRYVAENDKVLGYAAATVYKTAAWVGPLICRPQRGDIAIALVKSVLSELSTKSVYTVIPKKDKVLSSLFFEVGFREVFFVSRMFLGYSSAKDCIYLSESLERG
ncbi:MAG: GNAT family N-acetyltransferase [Nitrososphaerota archaeon]|jgi:predicted N-acetyltransferase YhbS|nr:GNAT family N-acetyltransferase [Nitrososphaerota archaeon]